MDDSDMCHSTNRSPVQLTYKELQGLAMRLGLPGNLKHSRLLSLVKAKQCGEHEAVENIVEEHRQQRRRLRSSVSPAWNSVEVSPALVLGDATSTTSSAAADEDTDDVKCIVIDDTNASSEKNSDPESKVTSSQSAKILRKLLVRKENSNDQQTRNNTSRVRKKDPKLTTTKRRRSWKAASRSNKKKESRPLDKQILPIQSPQNIDAEGQQLSSRQEDHFNEESNGPSVFLSHKESPDVIPISFRQANHSPNFCSIPYQERNLNGVSLFTQGNNVLEGVQVYHPNRICSQQIDVTEESILPTTTQNHISFAHSLQPNLSSSPFQQYVQLPNGFQHHSFSHHNHASFPADNQHFDLMLTQQHISGPNLQQQLSNLPSSCQQQTPLLTSFANFNNHYQSSIEHYYSQPILAVQESSYQSNPSINYYQQHPISTIQTPYIQQNFFSNQNQPNNPVPETVPSYESVFPPQCLDETNSLQELNDLKCFQHQVRGDGYTYQHCGNNEVQSEQYSRDFSCKQMGNYDGNYSQLLKNGAATTLDEPNSRRPSKTSSADDMAIISQVIRDDLMPQKPRNYYDNEINGTEQFVNDHYNENQQQTEGSQTQRDIITLSGFNLKTGRNANSSTSLVEPNNGSVQRLAPVRLEHTLNILGMPVQPGLARQARTATVSCYPWPVCSLISNNSIASNTTNNGEPDWPDCPQFRQNNQLSLPLILRYLSSPERQNTELQPSATSSPRTKVQPNRPCRWTSRGCRRKLTQSQRSHESICSYRPVIDCLLPPCSWVGRLSGLVLHLKQYHADRLMPGPETSHLLSLHQLRASRCFNYITEVKERLFVIEIAARGNLIHASIQFLPCNRPKVAVAQGALEMVGADGKQHAWNGRVRMFGTSPWQGLAVDPKVLGAYAESTVTVHAIVTLAT